MAKTKTHPSITKPVFDPEAALRFAAEGGNTQKEEPAKERKVKASTVSAVTAAAAAGYANLTMQIREDLLAKARTEAARKGRTLEEYIEKLISKHVGKH